MEFKSRRRQPKPRANALWDNTDLEAIAREVGKTAPHLFSQEHAPAPSGAGNAASTPTSAVHDAPQGAVVEDVTRPLAEAEAAVSGAPEAAQSEGETGRNVHEGRSAPQTREMSTPLRENSSHPAAKTRTRRRPMPPRAANESGATGSSEHAVGSDELAGLEAENLRLKRLLIERLRAENLQLKQMLDRFNNRA